MGGCGGGDEDSGVRCVLGLGAQDVLVSRMQESERRAVTVDWVVAPFTEGTTGKEQI